MIPASRFRAVRLVLPVLAAAAIIFLHCGCKKAPVPGGASPSFAGYTLIQQLLARNTDLIDMEGRVVHRWKGADGLAGGARLLPNGDLVRSLRVHNSPFTMSAPGITGLVERLDWDGKRVWSFVHAETKRILHHDIEVLPNGNLLMIGMEVKTKDEVLAAGRDPARMRDDTLSIDYLIEVVPTGGDGGRIVWQWSVWDHLVQDHDAAKKNHGVVSEHPELIDLNFIETPSPITGSRLQALQSVGYVAGGKANAPGQPQSPEWTHVNSIAYNAERDQIMLTVRNLGEVWVIDHSTSAAEAAGHSGGRYGRGGDLLYRWGNPQAYQRGKPADQKLFGPHDAHWIPAGLPGAGNVIIFNNGEGRRDGEYSSIEEIRIPAAGDGSFKPDDGKPFGPDAPAWRYVSQPRTGFYSPFLSGVQRLANGNTLICSGMQRNIFEVDPSGRTVWSYKVPTEGDQAPRDAVSLPGPMGGPPGSPGSPGGGRQPLPLPIVMLDANGDGFIDAAEMAQAPSNLKKLDRDGDGVLSIEECLPAPGGGLGGPGGPPGGPGGPGGLGGPFGGPPGGPPGGPGGEPERPPLPPIFTALDSTGDGKIDATEIARAAASLLKLDQDGDGRISVDECLPAGRGGLAPPAGPGATAIAPPGPPGTPPGGSPGSPPLPPIITVFGPQPDGKISAAAIASAPELLLKLDANRDGRLTPDEFLPGFATAGKSAPPMPPIVTALDPDGDGIIDAKEIAAASAGLAKLDRNGDGAIGFEESLPSSPDGSELARHGGLFRAVRFALDHPAFKGRKLTPLDDMQPSPQPNR